jgi:hypothetical protein
MCVRRDRDSGVYLSGIFSRIIVKIAKIASSEGEWVAAGSAGAAGNLPSLMDGGFGSSIMPKNVGWMSTFFSEISTGERD